MTKRNCAVGVCSSTEHCDEIAGCFSDPTAAVMRKALFFAKQILRSEGAGVTKQRHCYFTDIVIAIDKLADALDPDREKPFRGDILDLLEWAEKDVLEMRQQLAATADLDGIILCEKEPVAEVKKHTGSLKDMSIIVWYGEQPAEGTQLYRAKEQGT